jgi:hypothetical protein
VTGLDIRPATPDDADLVLDMLTGAARWLGERGVELWSPGQWRYAEILETIERGETYVACDGEDPVGTLKLQWRDPIFWPDAADDAGYVHRLAVAVTGPARPSGASCWRSRNGLRAPTERAGSASTAPARATRSAPTTSRPASAGRATGRSRGRRARGAALFEKAL